MRSTLVFALVSLVLAHAAVELSASERQNQLERQITFARCAPQINAMIAQRKRAVRRIHFAPPFAKSFD